MFIADIYMVGSYYSRRPSVRVTLVVVEQSRLICQWCGLRFAWGNVRFCKNRFTSNDQEVMISLHFMSIIVTQFSIKTWCVNGWSPNNCNFVDISDGTCPQWCNRYFFQLTLSFCRWWLSLSINKANAVLPLPHNTSYTYVHLLDPTARDRSNRKMVLFVWGNIESHLQPPWTEAHT